MPNSTFQQRKYKNEYTTSSPFSYPKRKNKKCLYSSYELIVYRMRVVLTCCFHFDPRFLSLMSGHVINIVSRWNSINYLKIFTQNYKKTITTSTTKDRNKEIIQKEIFFCPRLKYLPMSIWIVFLFPASSLSSNELII